MGHGDDKNSTYCWGLLIIVQVHMFSYPNQQRVMVLDDYDIAWFIMQHITRQLTHNDTQTILFQRSISGMLCNINQA